MVASEPPFVTRRPPSSGTVRQDCPGSPILTLEGPANEMDQLVKLDRVTRRFPMGRLSVTALDEISLAIDEGEFVAVAGPSGSGKSTLLHLIGCIDRPTSGRIFIDGSDTASLKPAQLARLRRERIGFVFQTFNLIPVFTAAENVEYPLLLRRLSARERRRRAIEALAAVRLDHRAGHRPDLLSGGERQRVAVARAIVHRPSLVLADEPTANLDTENATELIDIMRGLNRDLGLTFLFSTHDRRLLDHVTRVLPLRDGRLNGSESIPEVPHVAVSAAGV
jgi:putative ABC transport system ATP-binding protein